MTTKNTTVTTMKNTTSSCSASPSCEPKLMNCRRGKATATTTTKSTTLMPVAPSRADRSTRMQTPSMRCKGIAHQQRRFMDSSMSITSQLRRRRHKTPSCVGDRFIPTRGNINMEVCRRSALFRDTTAIIDNIPDQTNGVPKDHPSQVQKEYRRRMMSSLCNVPLDALDENACPRSILDFSSNSALHPPQNPARQDILNVMKAFDSTESRDTQFGNVSSAKRRNKRMVLPAKVLDAPGIVDDFYLNLMDWNAHNVIAVALGDKVHIYNCDTKAIDTIHNDEFCVTAVKWCQVPGKEHFLAIVSGGWIFLWDTFDMRRVDTIKSHSGGEVEALAFNQSWITSGARDGRILNHDPRVSRKAVVEFKGHQDRVCSLKWNPAGKELASGGNDNTVCIWDASKKSTHCQSSVPSFFDSTIVSTPRLKFTAHTAAVKAMGWCPFASNLLASGGGMHDNTVKVWNASTGSIMSTATAESQVTSLVWNSQSQHAYEFLTGHGCGNLALWKYSKNVGGPASIDVLNRWQGHRCSVLGLAISPDGGKVASVSGDETLKLFRVFDEVSSKPNGSTAMSMLSSLMPIIR